MKKKEKLISISYRILFVAIMALTMTLPVRDLLRLKDCTLFYEALGQSEFLTPFWMDVLRSYSFQFMILFLIAVGIGILFYKRRISRILFFLLLFLFSTVIAFFHKEFAYDSNLFILLMGIFSFYDAISFVRNHKNKNPEEKKSMISILPFCIVPILILLLFPKTNEPLQWKYVKEAWKTTKRICSEVKDMTMEAITELQFDLGIFPKEYRMRFTGYSGEGQLGGGIGESNKEMLTILGVRTNGNLYLCGAVSDTYTGSSWEKQADYEGLKKEDYVIDYAEFVRALSLSDISAESSKDFLNVHTVSIRHSGISTETLFYPLKTIEIQNHNTFAFHAHGPNIVFDKAVTKYKDDYSLTFLDIDYKSNEIIGMLQEEDQYSYNHSSVSKEEMAQAQKDYLGLTRNGAIFASAENILEKRSEYIGKMYLQLPKTLPQRVTDLALEITAGCDTEYEKMLAINTYLAEYKYTKAPIVIDSNEDFVDQFLFETKEGYCTYFSTATAVLGRCAGVPTRYVEGFYCNYSNKIAQKEYMVTGTGGHAWCEYYVEGIGWIPMEATTGCGFSRDYQQATSNPTPKVEEQELSTTVMQIYDPNKVTNERMKQRILTLLPEIIEFSVTILILLAAMIFIIIKVNKRKKYIRLNPREKVIYLFHQILDTYKETAKENLTVTQCFERIQLFIEGNKIPDMNNDESSWSSKELSVLQRKYQAIRYSDKNVSKEDVALFEAFLKKSREVVKLEKKKQKKEKKKLKKQKKA